MKRFGIIGNPLEHSFSSRYFDNKFKAENIKDVKYENFELSHIEELPSIIEGYPDLFGLNVTIPYKSEVIKYLDTIDNPAKAIGAVNTIKIMRDGDRIQLKGFNTDTDAFRESLGPILQNINKPALILGTGGSAKAVAYALMMLNIEFSYVSRNPYGNYQISYQEISQKLIEKHLLIINCSPVGLYPDIMAAPDIPYKYLSPQHILYDLIYNPAETKFLQQGKERGATTINGLQMLYLQAEKAWNIFTSEAGSGKREENTND